MDKIAQAKNELKHKFQVGDFIRNPQNNDVYRITAIWKQHKEYGLEATDGTDTTWCEAIDYIDKDYTLSDVKA